MQPVPDAAVRLVEGTFAPEDRAAALDGLGRVDPRPWKIDRERVLLAVLKLSGGDLGALRDNVRAANADWRDVLMWADER